MDKAAVGHRVIYVMAQKVFKQRSRFNFKTCIQSTFLLFLGFTCSVLSRTVTICMAISTELQINEINSVPQLAMF